VKPYRIALADLPVAVMALDEICFPGDDRVNPDGGLWWIAWCGKTPVAYAGMRLCRDPRNEGLAFLNRAGVVPGHRGRGLQKRLIRARVAAARQLAVNELVTYCMTYNAASINSLVHCGFRFYVPATKWGGASAVYLQKAL
jgi:RimJ/RimL family protein N-acetyltransferase